MKELKPIRMIVAVGLVLLLILVVISIVRREPVQPDAAQGSAPTEVQPLQQTGAKSVQQGTGVEEKHLDTKNSVQMPKIVGYPKPEDGAEFVGVPVLNECGAVRQPTECLVKGLSTNMPWHGISGHFVSPVSEPRKPISYG